MIVQYLFNPFSFSSLILKLYKFSYNKYERFSLGCILTKDSETGTPWIAFEDPRFISAAQRGVVSSHLRTFINTKFVDRYFEICITLYHFLLLCGNFRTVYIRFLINCYKIWSSTSIHWSMVYYATVGWGHADCKVKLHNFDDV